MPSNQKGTKSLDLRKQKEGTKYERPTKNKRGKAAKRGDTSKNKNNHRKVAKIITSTRKPNGHYCYLESTMDLEEAIKTFGGERKPIV